MIGTLPAVAQQVQQAQEGQQERETEVEQRLEEQRRLEQRRRRGLGLDAFGTRETVTFAQVLADPDNIELNIAYALTQLRSGDVRGAGATLERILLLEPDLPVVRILFAIVLFRLDNIDEAERELLAVRDLPMTDELRRQIDDYLAQIVQRRQRTRFVLSTSFSIQWDQNRNASPKSEQRLAADFPTNVVGADSRQDDVAYNTLARLSFAHDMGFQARHQMVGALTVYLGEQVEQDDFDLQAITGEFGYELDFAPYTVTPQIIYQDIELSRQAYLDSVGLSVRVRREFRPTLVGFITGRVDQQQYRNIEGTTTSTLRSGRLYQIKPGLTYVLNPTNRFQATLDYNRKIASRGFESYGRMALDVSHTWLLGDGAFLVSALALNYDDYDRPDPAISGTTRVDKAARARLTYGVPMGTLFGPEIPDVWNEVVVFASAEAYRQVSRITNYTYNNYRGIVGISRRWEF